MKALITLAIMLLIDLIVFTLIVPYLIKKGYSWYVKRSCRETVDVNPVKGLLVGGVK
jgi:hypothetical protein